MSDRIFLASPHMGGTELGYIQQAFDENWIAPLGENVDAFEKGLQVFTGAPYVTALSSGTAALHLAIKLLGIQKGDLVFCQDLTFAASVNPVAYEEGRLVFLDSDRETWNLDPLVLEKAIAEYGVPRAVIVVHLYGIPAKMEEICHICKKYDIALIEDAAEALGSEYHGKKCGTFGTFGVLSFNGNKIITTSGGGALLSTTEEHAQHALKLATQAREPEPWYEHKEIGYNYRLSNICAGIGRGQLEVITDRISKKQALFQAYSQAFQGLPVRMAPIPNGTTPNCWLSVMMLDKQCHIKPTDIIKQLSEHNIEARHVWKPMHMQPVFQNAAYVVKGESSISEELFDQGVCLPSDTKMTKAQQGQICEIIRKALSS